MPGTGWKLADDNLLSSNYDNKRNSDGVETSRKLQKSAPRLRLKKINSTLRGQQIFEKKGILSMLKNSKVDPFGPKKLLLSEIPKKL